jgi:hypothetical protein
MEELNTLARQQVDGLVLVATIEKKFELQIHLPSACEASNSPFLDIPL